MPSLPEDFKYDPVVAQDHMEAYFDEKKVFAAAAFTPTEKLMDPGSGDVITFPYYKQMKEAEEPEVDESLTVDKMEDDTFKAQIFEVGKAVGIRKGAIRKSGAKRDATIQEAWRQSGERFAQKADDKIIAEINTEGNFIQGFTSSDSDVKNRMTVVNGMVAKTQAFGDKADMASVWFMHSLHHLDLLTDPTAKFMQADANDPMYNIPGFAGYMLGMAVIVTDRVPVAEPIDGKKTYESFIIKPNAYGIIPAEDLETGFSWDMLNREWVLASHTWYAVKSFHGKVNPLDRRICRMTVPTRMAA